MDGDLAQAAAGQRPGTAFHAPQVRLVTETGQPLTVGGQPVSADIISAKVTLTASGVGQADIVLNNQRHDDAHRPIVPIWRYNKLGELSFGTILRIDMRYGQEGWSPMMMAQVTGIEFDFPSNAGAQVTLKTEDMLSLLKVKPEMDHLYIDFNEVEIAEMEFSEAGLRVGAPAPQSPFSTPIDVVTHEKAKSRMEFLTEIGKRMDFELFAGFEDDSPITTPGATRREAVGFFVPNRAAQADRIVTLKWGRDIIDFKPAFKVWDIPTEAVARGNTPRDRGTIEERVSVADNRAEVLTDLHPAPEGGAAPMDPVAARSTAFSDAGEEVNSLSVDAKNLDIERARLAAIAALRTGLREFLTAEISTIGFTRIRPGIHLNLTGFHAPFDGMWYVTQTVHTLNGAGYMTKSSLRRPGMLDPSTYPGAAA
ncbi:hypothetical protein JJJ17_11200 [Paracoccus caeni]|uniref:Phage protein D n=1 Tax=Paracoccus caeni TaxID=657651 RepID=A0A934SLC2_9RHOB|nr:hypothetical protein [Paracoccus caeni]MBK4216493.1 hypothetical protein [Paracoccus caeni]